MCTVGLYSVVISVLSCLVLDFYEGKVQLSAVSFFLKIKTNTASLTTSIFFGISDSMDT